MNWIALMFVLIVAGFIISQTELAYYFYDFIEGIKRYLTLDNALKVEAVIFAIALGGLIITHVDPMMLLLIGGIFSLVMLISAIIDRLDFGGGYESGTEDDDMMIKQVNLEWENLKRSINATMERIRKEWEELKGQINAQIRETKLEVRAEFQEELEKAKEDVRKEMETAIEEALTELTKREDYKLKQLDEMIDETRQTEWELKKKLEELENAHKEILTHVEEVRKLKAEMERELAKAKELTKKAEELAGIGDDYEVLRKDVEEIAEEIERIKTDIVKTNRRIDRLYHIKGIFEKEHPQEARELELEMFRKTLKERLNLHEREIEIITILLNHRGEMRQSELARALGMKTPSARKYIDHLEDLGIITKAGTERKRIIILNKEKLREFVGSIPADEVS